MRDILKIGSKIRNERKMLGLSLKELSEKVGVSPMTLQRIETDKISPSVSILAEIARHLMCPIDFFVTEPEPKIVIIRKRELPVIEGKSMKLNILAPNDLLGKDVLVNLGQAAEGVFIDEHREEGYSFVYILEGACIFKHDGIEYRLNAGDVLYYNARYTHSVEALTRRHKFISFFYKGRK